MKLRSIWPDMEEVIQLAIGSIARDSSRIRTRALLGALMDCSHGELHRILSEMEDELNDGFIHPEEVQEEVGSAPAELEFSPCVKEVFNFFRIHELKPIRAVDLSLRLLQIGTGSTVRELEGAGYLYDYQEKLTELRDSSPSSSP